MTAALEAVVPLEVQDASGRRIKVDAVIDTGFTGDLALPKAVVDMLSFPPRGVRPALMGDGRSVNLEVYRAEVVWDGQLRDVQLLAMEGALVGMSLLHGCDVSFRVVAGGRVSVEAAPAPDP